jgi:type I restriction enzyme, S subunit
VLPPFNEQKRIADKLDAVLARVDACRERLDRVPAILKRFRQAVLAAATSGKLTEEWRASDAIEVWRTDTLSQVAKSRLGKMLDKVKNQGAATPYLRNINVRWFGFDLSDIQTIRFTEDEARGLAVERGDVLICEGGEPGRCAVWRGEDGTYVYQKALHRVRVSSALTPEWLCYSLKDVADSGRLADLFTGTTIKHLTGVAFGQFEFPLPPLREQREIVRRVEALFVYADRLEERYTAARAKVERLTPALLAKAFRGELVPQYPNDEPASVLLEHIRAASAASEGTSGPKRCIGVGRPKRSQKVDVLMLTRKDVQDTHLTMILKDRGPLTAEAL